MLDYMQVGRQLWLQDPKCISNYDGAYSNFLRKVTGRGKELLDIKKCILSVLPTEVPDRFNRLSDGSEVPWYGQFIQRTPKLTQNYLWSWVRRQWVCQHLHRYNLERCVIDCQCSNVLKTGKRGAALDENMSVMVEHRKSRACCAIGLHSPAILVDWRSEKRTSP